MLTKVTENKKKWILYICKKLLIKQKSFEMILKPSAIEDEMNLINLKIKLIFIKTVN